MKIEALNSLLSGLKGAEASYPFGPEALVYKVMDKMFALVCEEEPASRLTLKCLPADGESLVSLYESISPGYYMNKKHWITLSLDGEVADEMIIALVKGSYEMVVSKLTKADKQQLAELPG